MAQTHKPLSVNLRGEALTIQNGFFRVSYHLNLGTWNYADATGYTVIRNAYAQVQLDNAVMTTVGEGKRWFIAEDLDDAWGGTGKRVRFFYQPGAGRPILRTEIRCYEKHPYLLLQAALENPGPTPVRVHELRIIDTSPSGERPWGGIYLGSDPAQYMVFLNSCVPNVPGNQRLYDGFTTERTPAQATRSDGFVYDTLTHRALVFGFLGIQRWWSNIQMGYDTRRQPDKNQHGVNLWTMLHQCEHLCEPGEVLCSETVYLNFAMPAAEAQREYAQLLARSTGATPPKRPSVGWTPAHVSPKELTEEILLESVKWLQQCTYPRIREAVETIHVPYGWQQRPGSLEVDTARFPHGMQWLAEQIHRHGFKAGIHLTPYTIPLHSPEADAYRRFLVHDELSQIVPIEIPEYEEPLALLDPSHPEAQAKLREIFHTVAGEWGYDWLAVDLLGFTQGFGTTGVRPRYYQRERTAVEIHQLAVQLALEAIESAGGRAQLMPHCGDCMLSLGQVPIRPLSPSFPFGEPIPAWETRLGIRQRVRQWAALQYLNQIACLNDLGVLRLIQPYPLNEVLIALTAAALSGAAFTFGDDWKALEPDRLDLIARVLPLLGTPCRVLDVYDETDPSIWHLPLEDRHLLAVFNWTDHDKDVRVEVEQLGLPNREAYLVYDFWSGTFIGSFQRSIELWNVPARSVRLLGVCAELDVPQFLSVNTHMGQGVLEMLACGWDPRAQSLLGVCQLETQAEATLLIHVPGGYLPASMACHGAHYSYRWRRPLYEIRLSRSQGIVHFSIHFGRTSG